MTLARILVVLSALAACGADGEPVQPTMTAGLTVGSGGVRVGGGVGVSQGPISLMLGF